MLIVLLVLRVLGVLFLVLVGKSKRKKCVYGCPDCPSLCSSPNPCPILCLDCFCLGCSRWWCPGCPFCFGCLMFFLILVGNPKEKNVSVVVLFVLVVLVVLLVLVVLRVLVGNPKEKMCL